VQAQQQHSYWLGHQLGLLSHDTHGPRRHPFTTELFATSPGEHSSNPQSPISFQRMGMPEASPSAFTNTGSAVRRHLTDKSSPPGNKTARDLDHGSLATLSRPDQQWEPAMAPYYDGRLPLPAHFLASFPMFFLLPSEAFGLLPLLAGCSKAIIY
jgi:hypothetical protein